VTGTRTCLGVASDMPVPMAVVTVRALVSDGPMGSFC
jgi:hypothetical protein